MRQSGSSAIVTAVDHVNFNIAAGELFGLLGPNGAGKTTIIRILCSLLLPDEGSAIVNGFDVTRCEKAVKSSVGVLLGGERGLYTRLTAIENLRFFADLYHVPKNIQKRRISDLLELVGLTDRSADRVERYSKGMKQRLHIARALVHSPRILLLDEPTIGLDPQSAIAMRSFIKKVLQRQEKKTILLTTHYMQEADQLCDRVAILSKGKVIACDTPEMLKSTIRKDIVLDVIVNGMTPEIEFRLQSLGISQFASTPLGGGASHLQFEIGKQERDSLLPRILELLVRSNCRIIRLSEQSPSLEDAFVSITSNA